MLYGKTADFLSETNLNNRPRKNHDDQKNTGQTTPTILNRIAAADRSAVEECLNKHGKLVWALAKQLTNSREEAETATEEIFRDIWKYAKRFEKADCEETDFIVLLARRWFLKQKLEAVCASAAKTSAAQ